MAVVDLASQDLTILSCMIAHNLLELLVDIVCQAP